MITNSIFVNIVFCFIFVVNAQEGWTPTDEEIYRTLVEAERPLFLVVNKADNQRLQNESLEFHRLGIEKIFPISSEHNRGIEGLLQDCLLYTSPSPRDRTRSRMPSSA